VSEASSWLAEFWSAQGAYDWAKTRSAVDTRKAAERMVQAVKQLEELGVVQPFRPMPTLDEWEKGSGGATRKGARAAGSAGLISPDPMTLRGEGT